MLFTRPALVLAALALPFGAVACGDDQSQPDAAGSGAGTTSTVATTTTTVVGTGTGEVGIAGTTLSFDAQTCSISGEGDDLTVNAEGTGTTADGKEYTVKVRRSVGEATTVESVNLAVSMTESTVGTNLITSGTGEQKMTVDGNTVTAELDFTGTGGLPSGPGTVTLTCD